MTNIDLYDLVDYIAYLRNIPDREENLFYLNCVINALGEEGKDTGDIYEIMMRGESCFVKSEKREYIHFPPNRVEDDCVYYVYRAFFAELKRLYLLNMPKAYKAFELLADDFHNLSYDILLNDLKMPFKCLKKCLKRYWRKYDRTFLRDFIRDNKHVNKS